MLTAQNLENVSLFDIFGIFFNINVFVARNIFVIIVTLLDDNLNI